MAARRAAIPFVTTYHGAYGEANALKRLYNGVMARGSVVIANSGYTAALIRDRYGTPAHRIEVIHRGVDPATFDPQRIAPARVTALRERWQVAATEQIILHPARLTRWKGQATLIAAAHLLHQQGGLRDAVVVLAGDAQGRDAYVDGLQHQIAGLGLSGRVRLVGHVEDIAAAYRAAAVTVVASIEPEAFGRTAIEAAAMGCPVIATNIGAPPETVLAAPPAAPDASTGWLVPPADPDALAARLREALGLSGPSREALAGRARRHVLSNFTTRAMQAKTLAIYDRLLGTDLAPRLCAGEAV
jgi:glycosyltransferase involved in cell wall biosynthesis